MRMIELGISSPFHVLDDSHTEPPIGKNLAFRLGEERTRERSRRVSWRRATDTGDVVRLRRRQQTRETPPFRRTKPPIARDVAYCHREKERERERKKRRNATEANDTSPQANSFATRARLGTTLPVLN
ncbi:hypothetical protein IGI04_039930 [Brassica rapa subsp. trilocularis]|uniref:Uncharacterized protein n=1 Tax=Brassica rapa subsp. trilocularis TaxID=1813537 RepID=A0ABQ7KM78_BRACM|nr:hypothetical protein IGI04_039930 [Brassica rapa subsp. trilocularis]